MAETSDAELMARVRAGEEAAFGQLVERYMDRVVGYLARVAGSRAKAEDIAQETFLRLYQRREEYRDDGRLAGYLYRIATNLFVADQRRTARRALLSRLFPHAEDGRVAATPQAEVLADEVQHQVAEALARVPLAFRAALVLHVIEGLSYPQIADALGCSEGTAKSRVSRGRAALKKRLSPYFNARGGLS